jgi:hypothetical protein
MATLLEIYSLRYESATLRPRTVSAVVKAAQDILNEDPGTANHANRLIWAGEVLNDPKAKTEEMLWGVVSNATIQTGGDASSDNDIQFVVNGLVDTFATGG